MKNDNQTNVYPDADENGSQSPEGRDAQIGGDATGSIIITGDHNIVHYQGDPGDTLQNVPSEGVAPETPDHQTQLPGKHYRELIGRDEILVRAFDALQDDAGKWVVGIDGIGGIGKTALAREIADQCLTKQIFTSVVWSQVPRTLVPVEGVANAGFTFETMLDEIARHYGEYDIPRSKPSKKESLVRSLLQKHHSLVVLDNLETSREPQNQIAERLNDILNPSKALLTSRHRFSGDVFSIHLPGLDEESTTRLIRQLGREKGIDRVEDAHQDEIHEIYRVAGGSPLAVKLIVGQIVILSLDSVLAQLREIHLPTDDRTEDDYVDFYKHIFQFSWQLLSENAKRLLISMSHFAPNVGGTYDAVKATSELPDQELSSRIKELWQRSFLEVGQSVGVKSVRYHMHALTQHFVLSDIVKTI